MLSANQTNHNKNILREKTLNFLNVPIAEYLTQQKPNVDENQYKAFHRNLQLQKQILNEQDDVHQYQTELFTKSVKQERVPIVINRPSVQPFRPTLTHDYAIPNKKADKIIKEISKIDDDLDDLAQIFYQRQIMAKVFSALEQNAERKILAEADQHRKISIMKSFFQQLKKKQLITKFKKSLKQR